MELYVTPPYVFISRCLIKRRRQLYLIFTVIISTDVPAILFFPDETWTCTNFSLRLIASNRVHVRLFAAGYFAQHINVITVAQKLITNIRNETVTPVPPLAQELYLYIFK
jgi:hypothetical protein